jgi:hypothetical protein
MVQEQLGELIGPGPETFERAILAAHAAVVAILTAEIGNLHDSAKKNAMTEPRFGGSGGAGVKSVLGLSSGV